MKYVSTRGGDSADNFEQVVLNGLAADGGLFLPVEYPKFTTEQIRAFADLPYHELAYEIISPYVDGSIPAKDLKKILKQVYSKKNFRHPEIAPLKRLYENEHILELFHGPTLAFKDFALQLLGKFFEYFLKKNNRRINILGATSGDTGSAAIAGCANADNINIFILHPHEKVSEVQRRQMTTFKSKNVHNIAVKGNFDDCQNIVKGLFGDLQFKEDYNLSAVNSINWARIVAQIVYYFYAAVKLGSPGREVSFSVPTGNFGDIMAAYIAHKMGLPIKKLIIATNKNDILHRFLQSGTYKMAEVHATYSPSMDIQISSNFERLLFDFHARDAEKIKGLMENLKTTGEFKVDDTVMENLRVLFASDAVDDTHTLEVIGAVYAQTKELLDPHSAIGFMAGRNHMDSEPMISLATAHAAKFPDAVKRATGVTAELPKHLNNLFEDEERYEIAENSADDIRGIITAANK